MFESTGLHGSVGPVLALSRDAKGYSLTVKLYPLAPDFFQRLAARDAKEYNLAN